MAYDLKIQGNNLVLTEVSTNNEFFSVFTSSASAIFNEIDVITFKDGDEIITPSYRFQDLIDNRTGVAFTSVDELKVFIRDNTGDNGGCDSTTIIDAPDLQKWQFLLTRWSQEPTFNKSITGFNVYNYVYDGVTRYRSVPVPYDPTLDSFYLSFDGTNLNQLITTRG